MIICITGPTGCGKTKLSEMLAKRYNAIIVNADATQVYKELNIGSDKITKDEMNGLPHFLFDIKNVQDDYSVCDYQKDARDILNKYKDRNIIVVGGSGLYINALFNDYKFTQMKNDTYEGLSNQELYDLALKKDSNMNIHVNNRVRLINFLNKEKSEALPSSLYDVIYIGLTMPRDILYEKVNNRVDEMISNGLIKEVRDLYQKYPESKILKRAIGYKEIISYLNNEITLDYATELIKKNTRHYVKRQYTWFNNKMNLNYFDMTNYSLAYDKIVLFIDSLNSK